MSPLRRHMALVGVLALATVLRAWGLFFGLPHKMARPDEDAVQAISLRFFDDRTLNPGWFDWPTLFMYAVAATFIVYFNLGRLTGAFTSENSFVRAAMANPSPGYLLARSLSVVAGVATVASLYRAGSLLAGHATGLLAAFYLAVAALHVRDSHFGVTDVAATCLLVQSLVCTLQATRSSSARHILLSALFAGLAASTKYNAGLVVLPAAWAIVAGQVSSLPQWPQRVRALATYGCVAALAFVAGSPYVLIDLPAFITALGRISAHLRDGHAALAGYAWQTHLTSSLRYGLGVPLLVTGIAGLALHVGRAWRDGVLVILFPVAYYALIGAGQTAFSRYILPVVPFLCLGAAYATTTVAAWVSARRHALSPTRLAWALAVVLAGPSLWSAVQTDVLLARTDNRLLAGDWMRTRFAPGTRIFQSGATYAHVQLEGGPGSPARRYEKIEWREPATFTMTDGSATGLPDVAVVPECRLAYCDLPAPLRQLLATDYRLERTFVAHESAAPELVFDMDDAFFVPLTGFDAVSRPGPNLLVYVRTASR